MAKRLLILAVVLLVCKSAFTAKAYGLSLNGTTKCGEKNCGESQFCSSFHNTCEECTSVCTIKSPGYEATECEAKCQNYLHDLRYVQKTGDSNEDLRATVQRLSRLVTVTLTILIILILILVSLLCFQLYRWRDIIKQKFLNKNNTTTDLNSTPTIKKGDLRLDIQTATANSDHSPITLSTSISRRPAEDSALDYAYDNPAMAKPNNGRY